VHRPQLPPAQAAEPGVRLAIGDVQWPCACVTGRYTQATSRIAGCGSPSLPTSPSSTKLKSLGVSPNMPPYARREVPSGIRMRSPWSFHSQMKPPCSAGIVVIASQ
jgi:hypothetical protein